MNGTGTGGKQPRPQPSGGYHSRAARIGGFVFTGVWLLYLVSSVAYLVTHHYSASYVAGGLTIIVVFSALYVTLVSSWPRPGRYALPGLAALALLAAVGCVFYGPSGMLGLWIFMSAATGLLVPDFRWAGRAVVGCIACYLLFGAVTHASGGDFLGNLLPVAFLGPAMIGLRRQAELAAELTRAREEVAQLAANEERLRLARDMHDLTGQSLSTITLKSELAARLLGRLPESADTARVREEIEQIAAVSRQTLRDIREAISGYRRPTLAVEIITARAALASAGIAARDEADLTLLSGTFDPDTEAALAWCLREAVTNVVRHSGAKNCRISLTQGAGTRSLTVRDDGTGHTPPAAEAGAGSPPRPASQPGPVAGTGLHGMAERLNAVGGSLELRPDARPGFCLIATVPAAPGAPAARGDSAADASAEVTSSTV